MPQHHSNPKRESNASMTTDAKPPHVEISAEHLADLQRLKAYFPYRIVYGAECPATGEWRSGAVTTMREPNRLAREGWRVVKA